MTTTDTLEGGRRGGSLPGGSARNDNGVAASTIADTKAMGSIMPKGCCGWLSYADDNVEGIGAMDAGGGDTAAALVNNNDGTESTAGPRMEVDNVGLRSGTARAGGVLNFLIVQDDAECGREKADGSARRDVDGEMSIGGAVQRWQQTEQAVGARPGSGPLLVGLPSREVDVARKGGMDG